MWDIKKYGNRPALTSDTGISLTYEQLAIQTGLFSEKITGYDGMRPLVFVLCGKCVETIVVYTACINNRIPVFMLPGNINAHRLESLMEAYRPEYIWKPFGAADIQDDMEYIYGYGKYALFKTEYFNAEKNGDINEELALLLSTSGTTGSGKTVRISYKNILANTISITEALSITCTDCTATTLPLHYTYGLSLINTYLYVGAEILVTGKSVLSREFWTFFNGHKGNSFSGVAYTYRMLRKAGVFNSRPPYLKVITQAGERLSETMYRYLAEMSVRWEIRFYPMYGQTEATARITVMPSDKTMEKIPSVGKSVSGGYVEIHDDKGNVLSPGMKGRLIYHGENVAMGYAVDRCGLAGPDEWNGYLDTGDMGYMDEEGYIYITGREDEYVKVAGNRISLSDIEELVSERFSECVVKGISGEDEIEIRCKCRDKEEIIKYLTYMTGIGRGSIRVVCVTEIEVTDSGKVKR